jgi:hypothetical protein
LRTRPDLYRQFLPALVILAGDPQSRAALVDVLSADPPWRGWFLAQLPAKVPADTAYAALAGLKATARPPRAVELLPYLRQLIDNGAFELAFVTWLHFLPADQSAALPYVYNGDFEQPISSLPFDWTIGNVTGAATSVVAAGDDNRGQALRIVFANTRVAYRHVSKLLVLPPGNYRLSGLEKADGLVNERGMQWRVFCAEGDKQTLGASPGLVGSGGWREFEATFAVPSTRCKAQWLRLELAARNAIEEQVAGAVWYDRLAITRADAPAD